MQIWKSQCKIESTVGICYRPESQRRKERQPHEAITVDRDWIIGIRESLRVTHPLNMCVCRLVRLLAYLISEKGLVNEGTVARYCFVRLLFLLSILSEAKRLTLEREREIENCYIAELAIAQSYISSVTEAAL